MNLTLRLPSKHTSPMEDILVDLVVHAHAVSALVNQNASSGAYLNAYGATHSASAGIASACMTLGLIHAPLAEARRVYEQATVESVRSVCSLKGGRVAGFGNSFYKEGIDPAWEPVAGFLKDNFPHVSARIAELGGWVGAYPNAAMFTAAMCSMLEVPRGAEAAIFVLARTPVWVEMGCTL